MDNKEVCFRMCSSIFITSEFHVSVLFALYVHVVCVCVYMCVSVCLCVCMFLCVLRFALMEFINLNSK